MRAGQIVDDRFEIRHMGASGGMGNVYLATNRQTGEPVALKVLRPAGSQDLSRFSREAQALAALRLPGVVRYIAHGVTCDGQPFLAMEWLTGETLAERLAREPLGVSETVTLGIRVARTLGALHDRGIIHRDLKPSNLLLVNGAIEQVTLIDFGIARVSSFEQQLTAPGVILGTPGYMAPEQARGDTAADSRIDVFALGCVLYKCLTGRSPFQGAGGLAVLIKVLLEEPPRVRELRRGVPVALDALVARMIAKAPSERPSDGNTVARELDALLATELDAPESLAAPSRGHEISTGERKVMCLVLTRESSLQSDETLLESTNSTRAQLLYQLADQFHGELELVDARSPLIVLTGAGAPTDLAARAARCALALKALVNAPVALVTGRTEVASRLPVGALIDQAFLMLSSSDDRRPCVRVDEVTAGLVASRFTTTQEGAWRVLSGARDETETIAELLGKPTTCVGRERELALLLAEVERCIEESAASAVLVTSEAGMGKSRLRQELIRRVQERRDELEIWVGHGDAVGAGSAFGLIASALRKVLGIVDGEPLEVRQAKIRSRVARHRSLDVPRVAAFLGELIGAPFPDENDVQLRSARRDALLMGDQLQLAWEEFVRAECEQHPVMLVLEDLHWGDLTTVNMIEGVLRNVKDKPFLALALGRPEVHQLFPKLWDKRLTHELHLTPLSCKASERLVREALGARATPELVARLVERADGNAFFLEEQIRAAAEGNSEGMPETVIAMVQARLEQLDPDARRVLRAASIFGETFRSNAVASLVGNLDVKPWLQELQRREVLALRGDARQSAAEYSFRHAIVREAAYAMLTEHDRSLGHALAGIWLENSGESDPMVLAEHYARGGDVDNAAAWFLRAADQALRGNDLGAAISCAERGIAFAPVSATMAALRLVEAEARLWRGEPALAERCGLLALEDLTPGSAPWFSAYAQLAGAGHKQNDYDRVERWMVAVLMTRPEEGASIAKSTCLLEGAIALLFGGRYARVDELIRAVESEMEETAGVDLTTAAKLLYLHGLLRLRSGDFSACIVSAQASLSAFEEIGNRRESCKAQITLGSCYAQLGDFEAAEAALRKGIDEAERMALDDMAPSALQSLGLVLAHRRAFDEAQAVERSSLEAFQHRGELRMECSSRLCLARILLLAGDPRGAEREACAAEETARRDPAARRLPALLAVRARAQLALERVEEALATTTEATALLEADGVLAEDELLVRLVRAEALHASGVTAAACEAIAAARNILTLRGARILDGSWRARFLSDVPDNARILDLCRRWLDERAT